MFVVTVEFEIKPEAVAAFMPLMLDNAAASLTEEPGCQRFDVCAAPDDAGKVFLYEIYDDKAAFDTHLASTHFKAFDTAVADMVAGKSVATYALVQA